MARMSLPDRRLHIVDAALAVALREGLDATTVRAIASEAGVSLGVLHYCFTDKAEIVREVSRALSGRSVAVALDALDASDGDRGDRVVAAYQAMVTAGPERQLLTFEIALGGLRDPALSGVAADQHASRLAAAGRFVEQVAALQGSAADVRPVARRLLSRLDAATFTWLVERDDTELRLALRHTWDALLTELGEPSGEDAGTLRG